MQCLFFGWGIIGYNGYNLFVMSDIRFVYLGVCLSYVILTFFHVVKASYFVFMLMRERSVCSHFLFTRGSLFFTHLHSHFDSLMTHSELTFISLFLTHFLTRPQTFVLTFFHSLSHTFFTPYRGPCSGAPFSLVFTLFVLTHTHSCFIVCEWADSGTGCCFRWTKLLL